MRDEEDDHKIPEGAVGGDTDVKSMHEYYSQSQAIVTSDGGNLPSSRNMESINAFLLKDVDLTMEDQNNLHEKKCNEQYFKEKTFKQKADNEWNIPVSKQFGNKQNDCLEMAMAERQLSFQSMGSEAREIPAMSLCNENDLNAKIGNTTPGSNALVTSLTGALSFSLPGLREDNNNISTLSPSSVTTSPNCQTDSTNNNSSNATSYSNNICNLGPNSASTTSNNQTNPTNSNSSATSSSRYSCRPRPFLTDDTLIVHCPKGFIDFISSHFNGRRGKNWEDLLSLYGWNYKDIKLFGNKNHLDGYFRGILEEEGFQEYTIGLLKDDLNNIPKKDTLNDVIKWIEDYNKLL